MNQPKLPHKGVNPSTFLLPLVTNYQNFVDFVENPNIKYDIQPLIREYPQQDFHNLKMPEIPDQIENAISQDSSDTRQLDSGDSSDSSVPVSSDTNNVSDLFLEKHLVQNDQSNSNFSTSNRNENCQENELLKDYEDIKNDNKDFQKIGTLDVNDNYVEHKSLVPKQIVCSSAPQGDVSKASSMEDQMSECSPNQLTNDQMTDYKNDLCSTRLFYCQTCCKSVSAEAINVDCDPHCAHNHVTVDFMEFVNTVHRQAEDVMQQAWLGLDALTEDIENARLDIETLDQRTREAFNDVRLFSRRMWSAMEEKENKLFQQIIDAQQRKLEVLQEKYKNLNDDKVRLSQAMNALKQTVHYAQPCIIADNPDDGISRVLKSKDMVLAEIWQIRQNWKTRIGSDRSENWISFKGFDKNLLFAIANVGNVVLNDPGTIGDRRPNRDHTSSPLCFLNETITTGIPRGRPIPNYDHDIVLPYRNRTRLLIWSTEIMIVGNDGDRANLNNLCRPWGVICDTKHIFVSDRSNDRIQVYNQDGTFVRRFGSSGNGPGQFNRPAGITIDTWHRIIVADKDNHRIQIFTTEGEFVQVFGEKGEAFGQFLYPWDVTTNAAGQIAISDTRNQRVQLFSPQGQFLCVFGGKTMPNVMKELNSPRGLSFTPEGDLLVTDFNKQRMVLISHEFSRMRVINCEVVEEQVGDHWKRRNEQDDELDISQRYENQTHTPLLRPQGVITDDKGNILVADSRHNCIQAFNSFGSLLFIFKPGPEVMGVPLSVAFLGDGRIAIVDDRDRVLLVRLENCQLPQKR
ncbi:hypothetical protein DMN91_003293 [Ooceraea biroi]|uniref:Tripartite motif-containing protein n=1 Tax=Ooceraea biroi TaxID=2015173 RepID=A0A3L8DXM6_OOCBI|nr:uncharacterized protein LOC105277459 isoform X2 [Ooceraea biroi]RLU25201.1 hypothetical protein DMN91_003293 [Ooceraea biroi]